GKIITLFYSNKADQMIVTAVFEKPVENTQIVFDIVRMTGDKDSRSYIKLTKGSDPKDVEAQFLANKGSIPIANTGTPGSYFLEPLLSAYFDTTRGALSFEESRSKTDLWIALTIGLIVIGVAVFNYLGVLSNKCHKRTKEFYVRRINGSSISNLIFRQTLENVLLVVFSFIISMFFILDALPFLNTVTSGNVSNNFIFQPLQLIPLLIILVSLILITLVFTNFLIKSNISLFALRTNQTMKFKSTHIPVLNIFQLACSTGLLISTLIIFKQINYINNKSIGLDKDIIEIRIPGQNKDVALTFRNELLCSSSIDKVSVTGASPLLEHFLLGLKFSRGGIEKQYSVAGFTGDENYFKVLGIDILKGSGFSETISANKNKCLINETMAALFSDEDLIGKGIPGMEDMIVTGIVKDFNYSSLKTKIEPAFISYDNKGYHLLVKPKKGLANEAQKTINDLWHTLIPDFPVNTESVRARYEWYHRDNGNFIKLIGTCCIISIFLAMIGLFAVSYQNTRYRIKEIGIRKIHGARTIDIMKLVNSDFARWVIIAFVFSVPIAGYEMHKWLESYAYKVRISGWIFILAGMTTLIIAFITVSWQSWRAATRNPVEALRYE
ncbi:MAG: ABC transporter permease, partial [Methanococcaceae archaeon]